MPRLADNKAPTRTYQHKLKFLPSFLITHLMTGPKNPQPAQIPHALKRPRTCSTNRVTAHRLGLKRALPIISDGVRGSQPAKPVTDPVCIARPDEGCDA